MVAFSIILWYYLFMTDKLLPIREAVKYLNLSKATLNRWQAKGMLKPVYTPGGHRRYLEFDLRAVMGLKDIVEKNAPLRSIVYARVSTHKQEDAGDLQRQKERLVTHAVERGYSIVAVLTEVASGLNENRSQLRKALKQIADKQADILLIENRDRLARFGFGYLDLFVSTFGGQIEVMEAVTDKSPNEELVEDLIAIVTSFSARIYGKCGGKRVAENVSQTLKGALDHDFGDDDLSDAA